MVDKWEEAIATARKQASRSGYRQTIRHYERLHESEPENPDWPVVLCDLYAQTGDYEKAFDRTMDWPMSGRGAEWRRLRAVFLHLLGRSGEAAEIYPRIKVQAVTPLRQTVERLLLTKAAGRHELAQQLASAHAERLRRTGVTDEERNDAADLFLLWVLMAMQEEDWNDAAQRCQAAIEVEVAVQRFEKLRIECMIEAADAAFHRLETRQAIALWKAVHQADPFDEIATTNCAIGMLRLGIAYVETGSPEEAIPLWEEVRRGKALDGYAAFNLALLSARLGRPDEAAKYIAALHIAWDVPKEVEIEGASEQSLARTRQGYVTGSAAYKLPRRELISKINASFGDSWWLDGLFPISSVSGRRRRRARERRLGAAAKKKRAKRRRQH